MHQCSISPAYFYVPLVSFIIPVFLTLMIKIREKTGFHAFDPFNDCLTAKMPISTPKKKRFLRTMLLIFIAIPSQVFISLMNYYIAIPWASLQEGISNVMHGEDENGNLTFGMFKRILKDTPVKKLPIYNGLEPIGESSIQTFLSLIFLIDNWKFVHNKDYFLGVKCPISIISMIFSCVSLLNRLVGIVNFIFASNKK